LRKQVKGLSCPNLEEVDRELAYRSLSHFTRLHWSAVDPSPFVSNWHIDAICEHLEAMSEGDIRNLIINIPPRHTKSLLVAVMWPAWDWLENPGRRFLFTSYAASLSLRDSRKCRLVMQSKMYQYMLARFNPEFQLVGDQNTKSRFENTNNGSRLSSSVDGTNTGEGGDFLAADDPNNIRKVESDVDRAAVNTWWDEVMSTRLNDPKRGGRLIIQQRSHTNDLTGHCLEKDPDDWEVLILPARYELENRCRTSLNFVDPRTKEDELLNPERFGEEELAKLEKSMTSYAAAGQLQQRPVPRKGGLIPTECLRFMRRADDTDPAHAMFPVFPRHRIDKTVRYWDKAGTEGGGMYTAGVLMHKMGNGTYVVSNVERGQWSAGKREEIIKNTAKIDADAHKEAGGVHLSGVKIWVEKEGGSGGKESAENTIVNLAGYDVHADPVSGAGDKPTRALPFAAAVEGGIVFVVVGEPWLDDYIKELHLFDKYKYKDQVDASSGAFNKLTLDIETSHVGTWGSNRRKGKKK